MKKYKLGELLDVKRGASVSGEYFSTEGNLIRLTLGNFDYQSNGFKENKSKDNIYYVGDVADEYILEKNDIITPLTEQALGLLGSTAKIPESGKYIQTQDTALVKVNPNLLYHGFAYYLLPTPMVKKQLSAGAQQTSIRHTSPDKIKDCSVYIPELVDQKNIANFLDNIEAKISLNRKANELLESMAKQLYDYWFVQFDFPNEEGKPYKSSGGKMVYNETLKRDIPEGWEVKQLAELTKDEMESICPCDTPDVMFKHYSIPAFDDCASYALEKGDTILSNKFVPTENDILVSKLNPWTSRVIWCTEEENAICSTEFVSLAPDNHEEKGFFYMLAKSKPFIIYCTKASTGTSHSHRRVNPEIMKMFIFPYQKDIISAYSKIVSNYIEKSVKHIHENKKLQSLRDYLLPLLMNGQVKVS